MADFGILDRNLAALSIRHPALTAALSTVSAHPGVSILTSKSGHKVPSLERDGRPFPMHSRFNPVLEGERQAQPVPKGFIMAFGLGGAYHLKPLLPRNTLTGLMIVEKDLQLVRAILEHIDLTELLSDSRVLLLVDPDIQELQRAVLERYLPVLYGDLGSISLRSRWDAESEWFSNHAAALKGLPESLGQDYTVQSRFGRRWFVHTINNLKRSEETSALLPPARRIIITAAGPSLHRQLPEIRKLKKQGVPLLATDTSLPFLVSEGITPDMVLSIDCQIISYHHFLKGLPGETLLILDLASPPALTRLTDKILFFSSGHPFSLYLNQLYRSFPVLDLSGGNVTHAALSLAGSAGAREIHLFGADFSYPFGRPYARGTYIYPYFQSRSMRLQGAEDAFWKFILSPQAKREGGSNLWRIRTAAMDHYHRSFQSAVNGLGISIETPLSEGLPVLSPKQPDSIKKNIVSVLAAGAPMKGWREILQDYANRLRKLPPLKGPPQDYLARLGAEDRQAWATLLPAAATFRTDSNEGPLAVEASRRWTLERIGAVLNHRES